MGQVGSDRRTEQHLLLARALREGNAVRLRLNGCSMVPAVWPGEEVSLRRVDPAAIAVGDLLLHAHEERWFVHRVCALRREEATVFLGTRGDALQQNDGEISGEEVLGRVTAVWRGGEWQGPPRRLPLALRIVGWMVRRSHLGLQIALWWKARAGREIGALEPAMMEVR
jgi:hypothetical protein